MKRADLPLLPFLPSVRHALRHLLLAATLLAAATVQADAYGDVNALLRDGQAQKALDQADAYIRQNPRDPQMRFLRGVILGEQGRDADAAAAFTQLTRDYPELPEPYNNLAAIHAAQGQYDKARDALENALRLNPHYVTAHENLGDIYARLAAQQYARATQYASASRYAQPKLEHLRQMFEVEAQVREKEAGRGTAPGTPPTAPGAPIAPAAAEPAR